MVIGSIYQAVPPALLSPQKYSHSGGMNVQLGFVCLFLPLQSSPWPPLMSMRIFLLCINCMVLKNLRKGFLCSKEEISGYCVLFDTLTHIWTHILTHVWHACVVHYASINAHAHTYDKNSNQGFFFWFMAKFFHLIFSDSNHTFTEQKTLWLHTVSIASILLFNM